MPPPTQPTATSSDTETSLLDSAEALFCERGYGAVGIREITERAGANIASIKYYFGSKRGLYLSVIRRAMQRSEGHSAWRVLEDPPADRADAARSIAVFVERFLLHVVREKQGACAPSLICREAAEPSDAIDEIVDSYIRPHMSCLVRAVAMVTGSDDERTRMLAMSVLGQVLFYKSFYAFHERLWLGSEPSEERLRTIAEGMAEFSLRGLGCDDVMIESALRGRTSGDTQ